MSSSDERSPKRQRRSYSPASPLPDTHRPAAQPPQTPPPSVHMSPSWQSTQLPGLGHQGAVGTSIAHSFPTPPSTAGLNSQMMARGASSEGGGGDSAQHTPAPDVESESRRHGQADPAASEASSSNVLEKADVAMTDDGEHRRTDHERQESEDTVPPLSGANVLYKLSVEPIAPAMPLFSQNVLELYGMQHVQASVARKDPVTGAKINKLRKSYDGKVKDLGLEGRNKASKQEGWFTGFLHPGWDVRMGDGRTMWELDKAEFVPGSESDDRLLSMLGQALHLRPGHLPKDEHEEWKHLLGLDDPANLARPGPNAVSAGPSRTVSSSFMVKTAPGASIRESAPASPKPIHGRPERQGKKRRYDDSSYEGYNEGYDDDGYNTGGVDESGRRGSGGKRQKRKDFTPSNSPPFQSTSGTSSSMVGVRSS